MTAADGTPRRGGDGAQEGDAASVVPPGPPPAPSRVHRRRRRVSGVRTLWLVLVWVALWGNVSVANVLDGAAAACAVQLLFPLPPEPSTLRVHPWALARFGLRLVADLVVSSLRVTWQALRPGPVPRSSVVEVPLTTTSDMLLTATVVALSVVPGSIVVEVHPTRRALYVHALGADTVRAADAARGSARKLEDRLIAALARHHGDAGRSGPRPNGRRHP